MERTVQPTLEPSQRLVETLARTLRHEVGDLLQTVYSAVAILQERLPAGPTVERRLLGDLRARAETCKHELDAMHDLICPVTLTVGPIDVAELAAGVTAAVARRFPKLKVACEATGPVPAVGDARKLTQAGNLLLLAACQAAQDEVQVQVKPTPQEVEWSIRYKGPKATEEQLSWLASPFATTHHALFGLGLALAARVLEPLGGHVQVENTAHGGPCVRLLLPHEPPKG
jgi:two-component system sensor histidine kinase RstB